MDCASRLLRAEGGDAHPSGDHPAFGFILLPPSLPRSPSRERACSGARPPAASGRPCGGQQGLPMVALRGRMLQCFLLLVVAQFARMDLSRDFTALLVEGFEAL